ncbi:hypothetical protein [Aquimarina latercula]|uniref:hypothetical protein n=1 Tax=Aquimarina latercula TaxID=987 RepID=UPI0003F578D0|nr:hypothetical protein [Aquimarina latercula]
MKKITLIFIAIVFTGSPAIQASTYNTIDPLKVEYKANQVKAEFVGKSNKSLYFRKIDDSKMLEFTIISMNILSKYDFNDKQNIGMVFNLTYEVQKLETIVKDTKNQDAKVSQFIERKILMNVEHLEGIAKN